MLGFIRKKEILKRMKEVKDGNRFAKLYGEHPAKSEEQIRKNCYSQGYEGGSADSSVINIRYRPSHKRVVRRRSCRTCGRRWNTVEIRIRERHDD